MADNMVTRTHPPGRRLRVIENAQIRLSDGVHLSALIWLPTYADTSPVPAILEYLPYPKRDLTASRDVLNHPYVAEHGYACIRVDIRGTGDSQGIFLGEYPKQEQDDALEVLQWIAAQAWCNGSIGMIGISWGGFNGLQVAARRPPELKAIISMCSTDDRYDNDVHYMGGCLLVEQFYWATAVLSLNSRPPDPALAGKNWRDIWLARLESARFYMDEWHQHQRRDGFWKHGSVCEDYGAIQCPVYLVGGWADAYTNSIFRMMENLHCPKKALVGPWGHSYPNLARPRPAIGFLQESVRWWDKWLKGIETGIMDEPAVRCYVQDSVPPKTYYEHRSGRWTAESSWPSVGVVYQRMGFAPGRLAEGPGKSDEILTISSPQTVGSAAGGWIVFGAPADAPRDQNEEVPGSLVFETERLSEPLDLLGAPLVHLRVASDKPAAIVAAVVSEVLPNGSATKISYGVLNLTHRKDHLNLAALEPGKYYDVTVKLNECGQRISAGNRLRVALSSAYFPIVWPSPETTTLSIDCAGSAVDLPIRRDGSLDGQLKPFQPAATSPELRGRWLREGKKRSTIVRDVETDELTFCEESDDGLFENSQTGWRYGGTGTYTRSVRPDDPLSARAEKRFCGEYGRGSLELVVKGWTKMHASKTAFHFSGRVDAYEQGQRIFSRDYAAEVPRDHV